MQPILTSATLNTGMGATGNLATPQPRLVKAAHEFEAQMMKELMKPLNQTNGLGGEGEDGNDEDTGSGGALGEFASEALGRALSDHGGFGMATRIVQQLTPAGNHKVIPPVTKNLHIDTMMKTS